jgi:hypothetical protein
VEIDKAIVARDDAFTEVQVQVELLRDVWRNRRLNDRQPAEYCNGAVDALGDVLVAIRRLVEDA